MIVALGLAMAVAARAEDYLVVSRNAPLVRRELTAVSDLRAIFLGHKLFWSNNERIFALISRAQSEQAEKFLEEVMDMHRDQYSAYWRRKLFAGKGYPPKEVASDEEALKVLRENGNSIAILGQKPAGADFLVYRVDLPKDQLIEQAL